MPQASATERPVPIADGGELRHPCSTPQGVVGMMRPDGARIDHLAEDG